MLAGMGACAVALFPLSLLVGDRALVAIALLMALASLRAVARRFSRRPAAADRQSLPVDGVTRGVLGVTALVALGFAALNFRYNYLWDGFQIWASKAQLLFYRGRLSPEWYAGDTAYDLRHAAYPQLVPLYEALLSLLRRGFDFDRLKPVFLVFYVSMLVSTFVAVRAASSARRAAVATLLLALLPALSTRDAAGAYADVPQAAVVAGVVVGALTRKDAALPWLIGALTTVKAEGTILAILACLGILIFHAIEVRREFGRRLLGNTKGAAIVGMFFIARGAYGAWVGAKDEVYGHLDHAHLLQALARAPHVARLCIVELLRFFQWGLLWPAFFVASALLLVRGSSREKALAIATAAGVATLAVPFLFTSWPVELHVHQAYYRLLAQLAPAAVVTIVVAYARIRDTEAPAERATLAEAW
jgi:hypothetical protein